MRTRRITLRQESGPLPETSALLDEPEPDDGARPAILLANGAGYHMEAPFMETVAHGLVRRGFPVLRFDYPYKERERREGRRRPPDRRQVLEDAHATALRELEGIAGPERRILLAGKSLGGRIASHLAAKDHRCDGLVLLGYPLHAPGRPSKERSEHFPAIAQPALFLQGTRDTLCDLGLLREALARYGGTATVEVIEDGDHGFHVPKRSGRTDAEVLESLLDRVERWERETFPA